MKWIAVFFVVLCSSAAAEGLNEKQIEAFSNVQMELSMCIAYFNIVKECAPEEKKEEAKAFDRTIKIMTDMAYQVGSSIGMTNDSMLARLQMAYEDHGKIIEKKCINVSSLYTRYGLRCKQLGEHPDSVLEEYMRK